ncbi:MAG: hypothetical protein AB7O28_12595 [Vicinamibacterales bacterium]
MFRIHRPGRRLLLIVFALWLSAAGLLRARAADTVLFSDDFSAGLARWDVVGEAAVAVRDSGDPAHGPVLELTPNGDVLAVIRGSDRWPRVRVEGDMRFPTDIDNYLGLAYQANETDGRWDFGLIYVKGNNGYLQANPHRDFNVSRLVYPESRALLRGPAAVETGVWQRFAYEVAGADVHVYVGPGTAPQMTFRADGRLRGRLGLQPRSVGGPVWVDNVVVRAIDRLSYDGPSVPAVPYTPRDLVTSWEVAGPLTATDDDIARHPARYRAWRPVSTDHRGAVVTGHDVDFHGPRTVAYYRTRLRAAAPGTVDLVFGTADDLAVWANGRFQAFLGRQDAAWHDVHVNPTHTGRRLPLDLIPGDNDVVVRVRGGVYASGGFFTRVVPR